MRKAIKYFSISETARRLKVTRSAVHAAIKRGSLKAKKGTHQVERTIRRTVKGWQISESEVARYEKKTRLLRQLIGKKK